MLYKILNEKVQTNLPNSNDTSKKIIYALAYFCDYISPIDIINILNDSIHYNSYRQYFHESVKDGLLKDHSLQTPCGDVRKVYSLTEKGYEYVLSFLPDNRKEKRKQKESFLFHNYGAGLFFLSLLNSPYTFSLLQEKVIHGHYASGTINRSKTLRIDSIYTLNNSRQSYVIYVEQDTGSESIDILLQKMKLYVYHGLFEQESSLFFSFYKNVIPINAAYRIGNIKSIINKLGDGDLETMCLTGQLSDSELETAFSLLSLLNNNHLIKSELETFVRSLDNHSNTYFVQDKIAKQISFYRHRRNSLFASLIIQDMDHWVVKKLLDGQQVWCDTSYLPSIEPVLYDGIYRKSIEHILEEYFKECDFSVYESVHCFTDTKSGGFLPVTMRNVYSYQYAGEYNINREDKTCYIAIENASHDLGGLLRSYYAIRGLEPTKTPLSLILVTDTISDALYISENLLHYCFGINFLLKGRFHIYLVIRNTAGLYVADGRSGKIQLETVEIW